MSLSVTALAANNDGTNGTDIDVNAKYVDSVAAATTISVDVTWEAMEFTYTVSGTKTWDAAKHEYVISATDAWSGSDNEITVTNHSNAAVNAEFAFAPLTEYRTVNGTFSQNVLNLPTAEGKAVDAAEITGKTVLTLSGTLEKATTAMTKVGTVTNHSNVGIMAKFNFAPEGDIEGSFTKDGTSTDKLELDTIKNLYEGSAAPSDTMNFSITGGAISENCKLGTITVYITPNDNSNYIFTKTELTEAAVKNAQ